MSGFIYEIKKGIANRTFIIFLLIFLAISIATSLHAVQMYSSKSNSGINFIALITPEGDKFLIRGFVSFKNEPAYNAKIIIGNTTLTTNKQGFFIGLINHESKIKVKYDDMVKCINFSQVIICQASKYVYSISYQNNGIVSEILNYTPQTGEADMIIITSSPGIVYYNVSHPNVTVNFGASVCGKLPNNLTFKKLGYVNFTAEVPVHLPYGPFYVMLKECNETSVDIFVPTNVYKADVISITSGALGLFSAFFPIIISYEASTLFTRELDMGLFTYLLSKPIGKVKLFLRRVGVGLLSSVIASSAIFLVTEIILLIYKAFYLPLLLYYWFGEIMALTGYFMLIITISVFVRQSNIVNGVSVLIYIISLFMVFIASPVFFNGSLHAQEILSYLNPLGVTVLATYQIPLDAAYGTVPLSFFLLDAIGWIAVLLVLSVLRFKKLEL
ncbi:MAG: ABC transporter permease subunit [Sulfolobus sp.]